jgi:hypothetical protein
MNLPILVLQPDTKLLAVTLDTALIPNIPTNFTPFYDKVLAWRIKTSNCYLMSLYNNYSGFIHFDIYFTL